ncbi:MAG: methyltransferase, TIGR04325 family [Candidatus Methylomirabilia bacterium]
MRLKDLLRLLTPPAAVVLAKRLSGRNAAGSCGLSGDYRSWDEAMAESTGYQSDEILEKTKDALLKVKNGEAAYERDSVLFDEIVYPWPVLAGLMGEAARSGGVLNVLDYGGSLGSTYFQCRGFFAHLPRVRWNVVEQPGHVEIGRTRFEDDTLRFYAGIEDCLAESQPNLVLLGGVLQYLERPDDLFGLVQGIHCGSIIVDRTPFWSGPADRLCVQTVPPEIYPARYPSWIFSRQRFLSGLRATWRVMAAYDNPDRLPGPVDFSYQGLILVRSADVS